MHNGSMKSALGKLPESLQEAVVYFSDPEKAHEWAVSLRWPNGIECPRCGSKEHSFISTRRIWFCKGCKKQFTVKVGSIFEDSPLGMDKWMFALWLLVTCKNGISSYEIASHLNITQKSAWHLMHRVRKAVHSGSFTKLSGECEADETFIGGKARNMHVGKRQRRITGTGTKDKTAVMGLWNAGGKSALLFYRTARDMHYKPKYKNTSRQVPHSIPMRCFHMKDSPATTRIES